MGGRRRLYRGARRAALSLALLPALAAVPCDAAAKAPEQPPGVTEINGRKFAVPLEYLRWRRVLPEGPVWIEARIEWTGEAVRLHPPLRTLDWVVALDKLRIIIEKTTPRQAAAFPKRLRRSTLNWNRMEPCGEIGGWTKYCLEDHRGKAPPFPAYILAHGLSDSDLEARGFIECNHTVSGKPGDHNCRWHRLFDGVIVVSSFRSRYLTVFPQLRGAIIAFLEKYSVE